MGLTPVTWMPICEGRNVRTLKEQQRFRLYLYKLSTEVNDLGHDTLYEGLNAWCDPYTPDCARGGHHQSVSAWGAQKRGRCR